MIGTLAAALTVLTSPAMAVGSHGGHAESRKFSAGEPGDARRPARIAQVTMTEVDGRMLHVTSKVEVRQNEQELGSMQHGAANAKTLLPKTVGDVVWKFTQAGEFNIPGSYRVIAKPAWSAPTSLNNAELTEQSGYSESDSEKGRSE